MWLGIMKDVSRHAIRINLGKNCVSLSPIAPFLLSELEWRVGKKSLHFSPFESRRLSSSVHGNLLGGSQKSHNPFDDYLACKKPIHYKVEMITQETNPVYWAFTHCGTLEPWTVMFFNFHFGSTIWKSIQKTWTFFSNN